MPTPQLLSALVEGALNSVLKLDKSTPQKLNKLSGKSLQVKLKELYIPLQFHFTEDRVLASSEQADDFDCSIACDIATLQKMRNSNNITQLIKAEKLVLDGDIHLAQGFSELLMQLNINWGDTLAPYLGDIGSHKVTNAVARGAQVLKRTAAEATLTLSEYLIEEKQLTPHKIQLIDFADQVNEMRADTERLAARIKQLSRALEQE